MAFLITPTNGLRKTGLSIDLSSWAGAYLGYWLKLPAAAYIRGVCMQGDADGGRPFLAAHSDSGLNELCQAIQAGGTLDQAVCAVQVTTATWQLVGGVWLQNGNTKAHVGTTMTTQASSVTALDGQPMKTISVGTFWANTDGSTESPGTGNASIALPFIAKREPTGGELASLAQQPNAAHPAAVFGTDLLDYWPQNSKTSAINGWVLADIGTVTIDSGDNPSVNAPPAPPSTVALSPQTALVTGAGTARAAFSIGL